MGVYLRRTARVAPGTSLTRLTGYLNAFPILTAAQPPLLVETLTIISLLATTTTAVESPRLHSPKADVTLDASVDASAAAPMSPPDHVALPTLETLAHRHLLESKTITVDMGPKSPEIYLAGACRLVKNNDGMTIGAFCEGTALCQLIEWALLLYSPSPSSTAVTEAVTSSAPTTPVDPAVIFIGKRKRSGDEKTDVLGKKARWTAVVPTAMTQAATVSVPTLIPADPEVPVPTAQIVAPDEIFSNDAVSVTLVTPTVTAPPSSPLFIGEVLRHQRPKVVIEAAPAAQAEDASRPSPVLPLLQAGVQTHDQNEGSDDGETPSLDAKDNGGISQLTNMTKALSLQYAEEPESVDQNLLATAEDAVSDGDPLDIAGIEVVWEEESNGEIPGLDVEDNSAINQLIDLMGALSLQHAEEPEPIDRTAEGADLLATHTAPEATEHPKKRRGSRPKKESNATETLVEVENLPTTEAVPAPETIKVPKKRRGLRGKKKSKAAQTPVGVENPLAAETIAASGSVEVPKKKRRNRSKKKRKRSSHGNRGGGLGYGQRYACSYTIALGCEKRSPSDSLWLLGGASTPISQLHRRSLLSSTPSLCAIYYPRLVCIMSFSEPHLPRQLFSSPRIRLITLTCHPSDDDSFLHLLSPLAISHSTPFTS
ncbi:hypothetical protein FRB93_008494 [Tulasnella sp. JGI-2019a]|nr:hypothetical protein FRB93_008494 [Tulasnella sp. JGI-2019a]